VRRTASLSTVLLVMLASLVGCVASPAPSPQPTPSPNPSPTPVPPSSSSSSVAVVSPSPVSSISTSPGAAQTWDTSKCTPPQSLSTIRPPSPSPIASPLSKAEVIAAVESFIGRKLNSPIVSEPMATTDSWYVTVTEPGPSGASAIVDVGTGKVMSINLPQTLTTIAKLTPDQALAAAEAYMDAHKVPYAGLTSSVTLEDSGSTKYYSVTFVRYVNGVTVLDTRSLSVDPATGEVFAFVWRQLPYGPVPSPTIDRQAAIEKAVAAACLSPYKIDSVQLLLDPGWVWPGQVVWSVGVSSAVEDEGYVIEVDAQTGDVRIIGAH
jgi:hypothetical protein